MGSLRWSLLVLVSLFLACGSDLATVGSEFADHDGGGAVKGEEPFVDGGSGSGGAGTLDAGEVSLADAGTPEFDAGTAAVDAGPPLPFTIAGGQLSSLDFGVVGDTRPIIYDDTPNYPTQVITTLFQDMGGLSPPLAFVVATGDYMFASPLFGQASPQAKLFVGAAKSFPRQVYPAMGNHECDWATSSDNCFGQNGSNPNYDAYLKDILGGVGLPTNNAYFVVTFSSSDPTRPWTAKFIHMAPNSWDTGQEDWLRQVLASPTTYTFLVRHEPTSNSGGAPGVAPSDTLLATNPFTLKLTGHSHSYSYDLPHREIVNGLGGAPLDTGYGGTYGYVVCRQRDDDAIQCSLYDYDSNALSGQPDATVAVHPDGTSTPPT